jgi:hypothetical protein
MKPADSLDPNPRHLAQAGQGTLEGGPAVAQVAAQADHCALDHDRSEPLKPVMTGLYLML